jgi:putative ABC transport system permease protein
MLTHYLTIAWRILRRNPVYSLINVLGLSVGIAACALIFLFVQDEFTYDSFHVRGDRIYRLVRKSKPDMQHFKLNQQNTPFMPLPLGPAAEAEIPGIEAAVRIIGLPSGYPDIQVGSDHFSDAVAFVDSSFFQVFSFHVAVGDAARVLADPSTAVITKAMARKYFGESDPMGRTIQVSVFGGEPKPYRVAGILEDYPDNSTIRPDLLIPLTPSSSPFETTNWFSFSTRTYVLLRHLVSPADIESSLTSLLDRHRSEEETAEGWKGSGNPFRIALQPLAAVHLDPDTGDSLRIYSYILTGIALVILLLAGINFATLAVNRSMARAREIGVRQVFGAVSTQLVGQQIIEASLLCTIAAIAGLALAELALPIFNSLTEKSLSLRPLSNWPLLLCLVGLTITLTLLSGLVPASILSRLRPASIFRREARLSRNGPVVRGLVVLQYALSITLLICLFGMVRQQHYIRHKPLGFNPDQVVVLINNNRKDVGDAVIERLRHELVGSNLVRSIAGCSPSFARGWSRFEWDFRGKSTNALLMRVDPQFVPTLQIKVASGRNFADQRSDRTSGVLVNEAFVAATDLSNPLGTVLQGFNTGDSIKSPEIIGVVKNFHILSLRDKIEPAILYWDTPSSYDAFLARVDGSDLQGAIADLKRAWTKANPDTRFEYGFLDDDLMRQYRSEQRWLSIISYSSAIAMVIALLGLFGLSGVNATRRQRELSVRKVLGAGVPQLLSTLNREFLWLIALANAIAWPAAYYVLGKWLQHFAYRVDIAPWTFAVAASVALVLATTVICAHTLRAALMNPVDVLRHE